MRTFPPHCQLWGERSAAKSTTVVTAIEGRWLLGRLFHDRWLHRQFSAGVVARTATRGLTQAQRQRHFFCLRFEFRALTFFVLFRSGTRRRVFSLANKPGRRCYSTRPRSRATYLLLLSIRFQSPKARGVSRKFVPLTALLGVCLEFLITSVFLL